MLQIWQSQLILLRGEWKAGEEDLQGAVRLHLQVTYIKTWPVAYNGQFNILNVVFFLSHLLQEQRADGQRALSVS